MHLMQLGEHDAWRGGARPFARGQRSEREAREDARRILVVDDSIDTVRSMVLLLRQMGHEVDFAINGYATLDVARRMRPQVVFLDLALPDIDGWMLARMLRRDPEMEGMRIYAVTGMGKDRDRERSLEAGCDDHLLKPLDPKKIEELLR